MFYYFLLAHLLGDFTFQSGKIAENKVKDWKWNLFHVTIITFWMLIFLMPINIKILGIILLNGLTHYLIDTLKSKISIKSPIGNLFYFIFDQAMHILILLGLTKIVAENSSSLLIDQQIIKFLLILVFIISFSSIMTQFILRAIFHDNSINFFKENEKKIGEITRITLFLIFHLSYFVSIYFLFGILLLIIAITFYYKKRWSKWMGLYYFIARLSIDLLFALIGFTLLFTEMR